jgi:hypothetical protein
MYGILFTSEGADRMFLQNVGIYLLVCTASQPRRTTSSSMCINYTISDQYLRSGDI